MKNLGFALAAGALLSLGSAWAVDWRQDYQRYNAAIEAGDRAQALASAEAAWRGASEALPDGDTKAYLAQNYIELIYQADIETALEPLAEAVRLGEAGFGTDNIPLNTLRFLLEVGEAWVRQRRRGEAQQALAAYEQLDPAEMMNSDVIMARLLLARRLLSHTRYTEASAIASKLSTDLQEGGAPINLIVRAESINAVAIGNDRPDPSQGNRSTSSRTQDPYLRAYLDRLRQGIASLRRARGPLPYQRSIENFDQNLATLYVYEKYLVSLAYSYLGSVEVDEFTSSLGRGKAIMTGPGACNAITWTNQNGRYPAGERGYNGAVLYGYHLDAQGRTQGVRVLGEAPGGRFGDDVVRFVSRWRADVSNVREECRQNQIGVYFFYNEADY